MWSLYQLAQTVSERPSNLLGITDNGWIAYTFDRAVLRFGSEVENLCNVTGEDGKRRYSIETALELACSGQTNSEGKQYGSLSQLLSLGGEAVGIKD